MNENQLKYFVAAAESLSFTKAAEQFFISQTAITQQIKSLEDSLGCELFDRSTRPVSLTSAGIAFLSESRSLLERIDQALDHVREASTGLKGNLRIGFVQGYERSDLSRSAMFFHRQNPSIFLLFYRANTDAMDTGLLNNEYDIIFTWDKTSLTNNDAVEYISIEKTPLVAVLYATHPFAYRSRLTRADLKGEKFIYATHSSANDVYAESDFMDLYKDAGFKPDIIARSTDIESTLMMVAAEEGISILPGYCVSKLNNADHLVFIPLEGDKESEEIIAVWRKDDSNPALKLFIESMKKDFTDK